MRSPDISPTSANRRPRPLPASGLASRRARRPPAGALRARVRRHAGCRTRLLCRSCRARYPANARAGASPCFRPARVRPVAERGRCRRIRMEAHKPCASSGVVRTKRLQPALRLFLQGFEHGPSSTCARCPLMPGRKKVRCDERTSVWVGNFPCRGQEAPQRALLTSCVHRDALSTCPSRADNV